MAEKLAPDGSSASPADTRALSSFEENLLGLLRRIPAATAAEREQKIAYLIPEKARAAAIAQERARSSDAASYLLNLARRIPAKTPRELERKILRFIRAQAAPAPDGRRSVCIVTRKPINNVTRAPRMAKALVDAGYRVAVVSPALPVPSLRETCPEVEYIVTPQRSATQHMIQRLEERRELRQAHLKEVERGRLAHGGRRAAERPLGRAVRAAGWLMWQLFVIAPCAVLLKTETQSYSEAWRGIATMDAMSIAIAFVRILNQRAATHAFARNADEFTAGRHFDVVQAYDNYGLVAAARLTARCRAKLVYDAVEIATDRVATDFNVLERLSEHLQRREERRIFLKADKIIGVGDALAGWYARRYGIPKPLPVRNCRYFWPYREDDRLRADIGAEAGTRILLWCGLAYPQQGIEVAIRALPHLPSHIHLAVVADISRSWEKYVREELPACASSCGVADRVHILPKREPNDLVPYISGGDIGLILAIPVNHPNQYYNLPNKFFESVMARLPIGTLAFPEIVNLVNAHEMGTVLDEHDSVRNATIIQAMLEPETYPRLKANVMKAAEVLCWERESRPYVELINSLMPSSAPGAASSRPTSPALAGLHSPN